MIIIKCGLPLGTPTTVTPFVAVCVILIVDKFRKRESVKLILYIIELFQVRV